MNKSLKLRVDLRAFCIIGILLKFDYFASKVESFIGKRDKKRKSHIGMVNERGEKKLLEALDLISAIEGQKSVICLGKSSQKTDNAINFSR